MGLLVKGQWQNDWYDTQSNKGEFVRMDASFRKQVTTDGQRDGFKAEAGRYHLFVSLACPWAHRTIIVRKLKGLEDVIGLSIVKAKMLDKGWELSGDTSAIPNISKSSPVDVNYLYELYQQTDTEYTGRVTVPVLWDTLTNTIVNNESEEIIRMLNSEFNVFAKNSDLDLYPVAQREAIETINEEIYHNINNGVYKAGFATTQAAYEKAFKALFALLDKLETRLATQKYLVGENVTEADWRLFTTLIRFDSVYYGHFKTNLKRIEDYPNISNYLRALFQTEGVSETVNFEHIKTHYYYSHDTINPTRVVPLGPNINYQGPHNRNEIKLAMSA